MSRAADGGDPLDDGDDAAVRPLSESNAARSCGRCGGDATAYVHGAGFRCGSCAAAAPSERRPGPAERGERPPGGRGMLDDGADGEEPAPAGDGDDDTPDHRRATLVDDGADGEEPAAAGDDDRPGGPPWRSWHTQTNSVASGSGADAPDLPSAAERVAELVDERPELAHQPLSSSGVKLRSEVTERLEAAPATVYDRPLGPFPDDDRDITSRLRADERNEVAAVTVAEAVYAFLSSYHDRRGATLHLEKRHPDGETVATAEIPAHGSFAPAYRRKRHAQLKGFEREITTDFEEPVVALAGLTASGVGPDGEPRPPADHMREIAEAWSGSGGVRDSLRNRIEHGMGLEPTDWAYIRGGEPHPGDGPNRGYHHDHPAVVIDAAALDDGADGEAELEAAMRAAVETHVETCPTAGPAAHDDAVERVERVEPDGEEGDGAVTEVGAYVGAYIGGEWGEEPPEAPIETVVWQATAWATTTQKFTAGRTARAMITADRCRSEAADGDHGPHGARLRCTTDAWGRETVECAFCGSHHGVPDTHAAARRSRAATCRTADGPDGDHDHDHAADGDGDRPELSAWGRSARAGRCDGGPTRSRWCGHGWGRNDVCPLCATEPGAVPSSAPIPDDAYDPASLIGRLDALDPRRPPPPDADRTEAHVGAEYHGPEWRPTAYETADGETHAVGPSGAVEYRTVTTVAVAGVRRRRAGTLDDAADADATDADATDAADDTPDHRRAILDALRGERSPRGVAWVAGATGLAPDTTEEWLGRLARSGRATETADGWTV
jgi:hypothetical protein